jgi:branched-chain amino acid transport system permease protein
MTTARIAPKVHRWTRSSAAGVGAFAVLAVVAAVLPFVVGLDSLYALIDLFILLIIAVMWNLLAGYGGMVSVGQQAYIGLGAYGIVTIADIMGVNPFLAVPLAAAVSALLAIPISFLAFRLAGGYFAVGTWVIAEVLRLVIVQIPGLGGGSGISVLGLSGVDRVLRIVYTYWVALGTAVIVLLVAVLLARSSRGLAMTSVRDDPIAAASSGVRVVLSKRLVFVVSAAGCGAAGALIALSTLQVQPDSVFSVQWSAFMIFMVIIGGVGTLEGPILGAIIFFVLQQTLAGYGPLYLILLGVIGVVFALFIRQGTWGLISRRGRVHLFPVGYRLSTGLIEPVLPRERR